MSVAAWVALATLTCGDGKKADGNTCPNGNHLACDGANELCIEGTCQEFSCASTGCPPGLTCQGDGTCLKVECTGDADCCDPGQSCNRSCVAGTCTCNECLSGSVETCPNGCHFGERLCVNGCWLPCNAEPVTAEVCGDDIDNDCDSGTDEPPCCQDECEQAGAAVCADADHVSQCVADGGCLRLSQPVQCSIGTCAEPSICPTNCDETSLCVSGTKRCSADGLRVESCVDLDGDGCFEWDSPGALDCRATTQVCSAVADPEPACCTRVCGEICGGSDGCGGTCSESNSTCKSLCASEIPPSVYNGGPQATGVGSCDGPSVLQDDGVAWRTRDTSGASTTVDGQAVSACVAVDFGAQSCLPPRICVDAFSYETSVCSGVPSDGCGGTCQACAAGADKELLIFSSTAATNDFAQYKLEFAGAAPNSGVTCVDATVHGTTPVRWVMVCRGACGAAAENLYVDHIYLAPQP